MVNVTEPLAPDRFYVGPHRLAVGARNGGEGSRGAAADLTQRARVCGYRARRPRAREELGALEKRAVPTVR